MKVFVSFFGYREEKVYVRIQTIFTNLHFLFMWAILVTEKPSPIS